MAARSGPGIPGLAVGAAALGAFLIYMGVKNVGFLDGLRSLLQGTLPTGHPSPTTQVPSYLLPIDATIGADAAAAGLGAPAGGAGYAAIAEDAKHYLGVRYVWGGNTPLGWDCSGFVTWVLHHDMGYDLPNNTHTTSLGFMLWTGAKTISRSECAAGDLCCWPGHVGIAVSGTDMVNAPTLGIPTRQQKIYAGVTVRRINTPPPSPGGTASIPGPVGSSF